MARACASRFHGCVWWARIGGGNALRISDDRFACRGALSSRLQSTRTQKRGEALMEAQSPDRTGRRIDRFETAIDTRFDSVGLTLVPHLRSVGRRRPDPASVYLQENALPISRFRQTFLRPRKRRVVTRDALLPRCDMSPIDFLTGAIAFGFPAGVFCFQSASPK